MNSAPPSMVSPSKPQFKYTLPVFLFFSACGFYFIVMQMALSHAPDRFLEVHKASKVPLSLTNNKLPIVDDILTPLISFFIAAFGNPDSKAYPTVVDFVWSFGAAIQLPLLEAQREKAPSSSNRWANLAQRALSQPMLWGVFYQRLSGGWILPLWLLCYMHAGTRIRGTAIDAVKAESVLFGWWAGHTLPALAMLVPGQPALTSPPIWIAFPILMSVAQSAYLAVRTRFFPSPFKCLPERQRGYYCTQILFASALVASAVAHFHVVLIPGLCAASASAPFSSPRFALVDKFLGLARDLATFYAPATGLRTPSPASTTADSGVVHFVQFDVLVVFAAVWTALLWDLVLKRRDAEADAKAAKAVTVVSTASSSSASPISSDSSASSTIVWVTKVLALLFASAMAAGFGAATGGLLIYRENFMEKRRQELAEQSQLSDRKPMVQTEETPLATTYGSFSRS